jgi:hypothetical protein
VRGKGLRQGGKKIAGSPLLVAEDLVTDRGGEHDATLWPFPAGEKVLGVDVGWKGLGCARKGGRGKVGGRVGWKKHLPPLLHLPLSALAPAVLKAILGEAVGAEHDPLHKRQERGCQGGGYVCTFG